MNESNIIRRIFQFPLWVLVLIALLNKKPVTVDGAEIAAVHITLCSLENALPIPQNRIEAWAFRRVTEWINRERQATAALINLDIELIGSLPRK